MKKEHIRVKDKNLGFLYFPEYDQTIAKQIQEVGIWEPDEIRFLIKNIKPGDKCINVGANVGYFSLLMSKLVGRSGKVFAIEANPDFKKYIEKNVSSSKLNNTEIIMSAAGNDTGTISLYINMSNGGDNRVFNPELISDPVGYQVMNVKEVVSVPLDTVDNLVKDRDIDLVLIDCQGFDHNVVRGMKNIIKSSNPKIVVELEPTFTESLGENVKDVLNEYIDFGYRLYNLAINSTDVQTPDEIIDFLNNNIDKSINVYMEPVNEKSNN